MEEDLNLVIDKLYTASIEWNNEREDSSFSCEMVIDEQRVTLENFAKHLDSCEGWTLELRLRDNSIDATVED